MVKLFELLVPPELHQVGPAVTVTVTTPEVPEVHAIVPEKSPTATLEGLGEYVVVAGVCSKACAYCIVAVDDNAARAPCCAYTLASACIFINLGTATAAKIPKITNTAIISINVKPF